MTAAYRMVVVESKDLSRVTVMCGCGSAITVSLEIGPLPSQCPSCNEELDKAGGDALAAIQRFYRLTQQSQFRFEFAIRDEISK